MISAQGQSSPAMAEEWFGVNLPAIADRPDDPLGRFGPRSSDQYQHGRR
jgi:hypothetical protein